MGLKNSFSINISNFEKLYLYLFNIYIAICGAITIGWTTSVYLYIKDTESVRFETWKNDAIVSLLVLIMTGISLVIVAFFGGGFSIMYFNHIKYRNQWTSSPCAFAVCKFLFLVMMIFQSAAAIYVLVTIPTSKGDFIKAFNNYFYRTEAKLYVDHIQDTYVCCGINSYRDYEEILDSPIPGSCCFNIWDTCTVNNVKYRLGCAYLFNGYTLSYRLHAISIFTIVIATTEFIGFMVELCLLIKRIAKKNQAMRYQETHVTFNENNSN